MEYEKLATGYEFTPVSFKLDNKVVMAYLKAIEDNNRIYEEDKIAPPMVIAALAMADASTRLVLPPGVVHVSQ